MDLGQGCRGASLHTGPWRWNTRATTPPSTDLTLDAGGAEPIRGKWYVFGSAHGGGIVPNGDVIRELRTGVNLGVWTRTRFGLWQIYALGFLGNEVGINRGDAVVQGRVGVRWVP